MTGATPSFDFTTPGTYTVSLTVTDDQTPALSDTDLSPAVVTISPAEPLPPTADAGGPYFATLPSGTVVFDGTGSHGNPLTVSIVSYAWTIYDDIMTEIGTMTGATPSFDFTTPGTYTVSLTVTDDQTPALSDTDLSPNVVTISPGPLFKSGNIIISWAVDNNHGRLKFEDFVLDSAFSGIADENRTGLTAGWRRLIITLDPPHYFGAEPLLLSLTSSDPIDIDPSTVEVVGTQTTFTVDLKIEGIRVGIITMKVQGQTGTFPIIIDENLTNLDDANNNPITFDVQGVEVIVTN